MVQSINQISAPQLVLQGAPVVLECTYTITGYPDIIWYVHHPGKAPVILQGLGKEEEENGFTAKHDREQ
ncbi:hypothetical protein GDO78_021271 [Eleutherodactylus coqui]|uniref:Immunoglobulin V-set domain-containing protein n=1 Tax=Eleutherodactylus coqui TaxID=57060 RepID=A0A8J6BJ26_ELECQ|nr:hypothetical protein GDO78_021271 [Eleutherodactylus coqui]